MLQLPRMLPNRSRTEKRSWRRGCHVPPYYGRRPVGHIHRSAMMHAIGRSIGALFMHVVAAIAGISLILMALVDAFETILQPRRVTHRFRLARFYYRGLWWLWRIAASLVRGRRVREALLSAFGPLSLLGLFATW